MRPWTDEEMKKLQKLWNEGARGGELAKLLERPRNAIMGKINLLRSKGWEFEDRRGDVRGNPRAVHYARVVKMKQKAAAPPPQTPPPRVLPAGVPFDKLGSDACHWPIGDPRESTFRFCGAARYSDKPYCMHHFAKAGGRVRA